MKKLLTLLSIVLLTAGCSNMLTDLMQVELGSGDKLILIGTDGKEVTVTTVDTDSDGEPDGIDVNGDGAADFDIIADSSTPSAGVYAVDTNEDGQTDMYITVSSTGVSTINTATDGTGTAVTVAVDSDGTISLGGDDAPTVSSSGTGTGTGTDTGTDSGTDTDATIVAATTDINGDGNIDAADTALLAKLTFTVAGDTVTITGADSDISGVLNIPATYDGKAVTSIGNLAFEDCSSLTSVTIPEGVTSVGQQAFMMCSGLTSVSFPESLTSIESGAFEDCTSLTSVTLPSGLTTINDSFAGCTALTSIDIPSGVTSIGLAAFQSCTALTTITIPTSVTEIGFGAFNGCSSLASITIPDAVTEISGAVFTGCTSLSTITIPAGVTDIGETAFYGCTGLTSITMLPDPAPTAAANMLEGITAPVGLTYPDGATGYDEAGTIWVNTAYVLKDGDVDGDGVVDGDDDTLLATLTWDTATPGISKLQLVPDDTTGTIVIPRTYNGNPVTVIMDGAFLRCTLLTSITIPSSVTTMESSTFYECTGLETLIMLPTEAPTTATTPFTGITEEINIKFPENATGYDASPWAEARVGDVNCDGTIDSADVNKFNKLTFTETATEAILINCETSITDKLKIPQRSNGKPVTAIGNSAFENCTSLYSVKISAGITTIGDDAFKNATNLKAFTMMQNAAPSLDSDVFSGITEAYLTIPTGATGYDTAPWNDITFFFREGDLNGDGVVDGADGLIDAMLIWNTTDRPGYCLLDDVDTAITGRLIIPLTHDDKPVIEIDDGAFASCNNLTSVVIPDSVTRIGIYSFWPCSSLNSVIIPNSVTAMESHAFYACTSLTSVNIPGSVESIGESAFEGCTALTSVNIASGVTEIDQSAFKESGLTSINIPGSVTNIFSSAFYGCTSLATVTMESGVTSIQVYSFEGCTSLLSVEMPDTVTSLGTRIFYGCHALESVTLSSALPSIPDSTFRYCYVLESISLPSGITSIGDYAFHHCDALTSVDIPAEVTTIETYAFQDCTNIKTITMQPAIAPTVSSNTFSGVTGCTLRYPSGASNYTVADTPWVNATTFSTVETF